MTQKPTYEELEKRVQKLEKTESELKKTEETDGLFLVLQCFKLYIDCCHTFV